MYLMLPIQFEAAILCIAIVKLFHLTHSQKNWNFAVANGYDYIGGGSLFI